MTKIPDRSRQGTGHRRNGKGRYDSALIAAKGRRVSLVLALPTDHTDENGQIECYVREVDTYSIKVTKSLKSGTDFWISKAFIVQTTIL